MGMSVAPASFAVAVELREAVVEAESVGTFEGLRIGQVNERIVEEGRFVREMAREIGTLLPS